MNVFNFLIPITGVIAMSFWTIFGVLYILEEFLNKNNNKVYNKILYIIFAIAGIFTILFILTSISFLVFYSFKILG